MIKNNLLIAWSMLWKHPLPTLLTLLSLTVGIAALPASLAIGTGAGGIVGAHLERWGGANTFGVKIDRRINNGRGNYIPNPERLTLDDVFALEVECPSVTLAVPETLRRYPIRANGRAMQVTCQATLAYFQEAQNWFVEKGRFFSEDDVDNARRVCVIGYDVQNKLFGNKNPIRKTLQLGYDKYHIIGVMEKRGNASLWKGVDRRIWIPMTTASRRIYGKEQVEGIWVKTTSEDTITAATVEVEGVLRKRHRNRKFFRFWYMHSGEQFPNSLSRSLNSGLLGTIAIGSILIAGLGLVNVSTITMHQRRREIGLRKAVGATNRVILTQFICESILLCLVGIPLGIFASSGLLKGLRFFVERYILTKTSWPVAFTSVHIGLGAIVGMAIVFLVNLYPTWLALKIPPAVSLKD